MEQKYPECEKLAEVADLSNKIGEFIDWLRGQDIELAKWQDGITDATRIADAFRTAAGKGDPDIDKKPDQGYFPIRESTDSLLARFFQIDLRKVEAERRAMLESIRHT